MVREATIGDVDAIARLAARTFHLACPPTTPPDAIAVHIRDELNADRFRQHMRSAQLLVVDGEPGEVCGYVMITAEPPPIETDWRSPAELRRIYVDAERHSSGVARDLMLAALDLAANAEHDWMWLGTNEHNSRALRFYEKFGFRIVGGRTFRVGDSIESDHVLARPVP